MPGSTGILMRIIPLALIVPLPITGCSLNAGGQHDRPRDMELRPQNAQQKWSFREKRGVARYEVRPNDHWEGDGKLPKERSEAYTPRKLDFDKTWDVKFQIMIEPGPRNTAPWMTLAQLQSTFDPGEKDGHSPPFALEMKGERMRFASRSSDKRISMPNDFEYVMQYQDDKDIRRGHWYDIHIRVHFDSAGKGLLQVWRDGVQLVDYRGPIGFRDIRPPYYKQGVYRGSAKEPYSVRFRKLSIEPVAAR